MNTESRNPRSYGLDKMTAEQIVRLMNEEEYVVMQVLQSVESDLARCAEKVAETFQSGGRIIYVGSGTSGRIAAMDAAEMPPTFGLEPGVFIALVSEGPEGVAGAPDSAEEDEHAAVVALNQLRVDRNDIVIGLTASGRTPFAIAAVRHARQKGVWTCGIANNRNSKLLRLVDLPILLDTGPEVLTGSTRLKAGTALKLALNRISTAAMVLSGKVIENLMVDVKPVNQKHRERCARIVRDLTTATLDEAYDLLEKHDWNVRRVLGILRPELVASTR